MQHHAGADGWLQTCFLMSEKSDSQHSVKQSTQESGTQHPMMQVLNHVVALAADDPAEADAPVQQETPEPHPESEAKVLLVCKTQRHGNVKLRLRKGDPMSKLFSAFQLNAERKGWVKQGAEMRFEFDGERLSGEETPAALEADEGDVIDVVYTALQ